jgi:hypothetical protein
LPRCPVLSDGPAMLLEWLDIWNALYDVGYAGDYNEPVPMFGEVAA